MLSILIEGLFTFTSHGYFYLIACLAPIITSEQKIIDGDYYYIVLYNKTYNMSK